jgi:hypothetical protein
MKKIIVRYFLLVASLLLFNTACDELDELLGIEETQESDIKDIFEDERLRECVSLLTDGLRADEVFNIVCAGVGVTSLKGLEQFPNLMALIMNTNRLSEIDLSPFPKMRFLDLSANRIQEIDLSHTPELEELYLDLNSIDALDVSNNPKLEILVLSGNGLSSLDLSNQSVLAILVLDQNEFVGDLTQGALILDNNVNLNDLNLFGNQITNIDVSKNLKLDELDLRKNNLSQLDVSKNTNLTELRVNENMLTSLNVSQLTILDGLFADDNQISEINLPLTGKLRFIFLNNNNISCDSSDCNGLDVFQIPRNNTFIHLDLANNSLSTDDLDLLQNLEFTELILTGNAGMSGELDLFNSVNLNEVRIDDTNISSVRFEFSNAMDVFGKYAIQVLTAVNTPLDVATQNLLDDMESQKSNHPVYTESELLLYTY